MNIIKNPYENDYCDKCLHHYQLSSGTEEKCSKNRYGIQDMMCKQVEECLVFKEKWRSKC